jgi:hypothetical protein
VSNVEAMREWGPAKHDKGPRDRAIAAIQLGMRDSNGRMNVAWLQQAVGCGGTERVPGVRREGGAPLITASQLQATC